MRQSSFPEGSFGYCLSDTLLELRIEDLAMLDAFRIGDYASVRVDQKGQVGGWVRSIRTVRKKHAQPYAIVGIERDRRPPKSPAPS